MTKRECAIVTLYTGFAMLQGDDLRYLYEYAESLLGEPVMTHELLTRADELMELARTDFIALCEGAAD